MNYNIAFVPTAAAKRFIKGHALNTVTYLLIVAIVVLAAIQNGLNWLATQYDNREIYSLQIQLKQALAKRFIVRQAIRAEKFRLTHSPRIVSVMDKVFFTQLSRYLLTTSSVHDEIHAAPCYMACVYSSHSKAS